MSDEEQEQVKHILFRLPILMSSLFCDLQCIFTSTCFFKTCMHSGKEFHRSALPTALRTTLLTFVLYWSHGNFIGWMLLQLGVHSILFFVVEDFIDFNYIPPYYLSQAGKSFLVREAGDYSDKSRCSCLNLSRS